MVRCYAHPGLNGVVAVLPDPHPQDPRAIDDNLGHMYCISHRYRLGDPHDLSYEELCRLVERKDVISLPLYLLDHSGLRLNTSGFSDCDPQGWDWGLVGFIWCTRGEVLEAAGKHRLTAKLRRWAEARLEEEVRRYDSYLSGETYAVALFRPGEESPVELVAGYYGREEAEHGAMKLLAAHVADPERAQELDPEAPPTCPFCGRSADELEAVHGIHGYATWRDGGWEEAYDQYSEGTAFHCVGCGADLTWLVEAQALAHRISQWARQR